MKPAPSGTKPPRKSVARVLWACFTFFVIYGTTIPFSFDLQDRSLAWIIHKVNWSALGDGHGHGIPDIVQNVLLFIPFGFLGYLSLIEKRSIPKLIAIVLLGTGLSTMVEFLQVFSWTRYSALSDVVTNTVGTAVGLFAGIALKRSVMEFKSHPETVRLVKAESVFPAFIFLVLAVVGCWEPFDFSLDPGMAWDKIKPLLHDPFRLSLPDDELISFIRFLFASLFLARVGRDFGLRRPGLIAVLAVSVLGVALELSQLIIASRGPQVQDAAVSVAGAVAGGLAFLLPAFHERPRLWSVAGAVAIFLSAAMRELYPFRLATTHGGFNWIPFLPHYEATTFASLGHFLESCLVFFPLGFLFAYFFRDSRRVALGSALLCGSLALVLEWAQGHVEGRYSDVTDAIGAVLGSLAGSLMMTRGWRAFRDYMEWREPEA
jgi:glycopeptide antibiotics resistance protein